MKKGFTLAEVLVVVVILGVVSLISFPIVKNIVQKNREKTFIEAAEGVIRSTQLYISANAITENFNTSIDSGLIPMDKNHFTSGTIYYENGIIRVQYLTDGETCVSGTKDNLQIQANCPTN